MDLTGRQAPEELSRATVTFTHGARKNVGSFYSTQPCLLLFLRHAACPSCGEQVEELLPSLPNLKKSGVRVVLVGLADPSLLLPFRERIRLEDEEVDLVTDPSMACHQAAGLIRSAWSTFRPASVSAALGLYARGKLYRGQEGDGDVLQQGGALFIDQGGTVLLHHVSQHLGDRVDMQKVVDCCPVRSAVVRF